MPSHTAIVYATFLTTAGSAALAGAVLAWLSRHYQRSYLDHWAASWGSLALYQLFGALLIPGSVNGLLSPGLRLFVSLAAGVCGYLQIAFLLAGTRELLEREPIRRRTLTLLVTAAAVAGLATTGAFLGDPGATRLRFLVRFGGRGLVGGVAFLLAAWGVSRALGGRPGLGRRLLCGSFAAYGVQLLHYAGIAAYGVLTRGRTVPYGSYLGFADGLLQAIMAVGMVTHVLEEERDRAIETSARIEFMAYHDALTGLPNRRLLLDRLEHALTLAQRRNQPLTLVFLSVDRFRLVNDSLGHSFGDALLSCFGQRLTSLVRSSDTVARVGGDEFAILLENVDSEDPLSAATKVIEGVRRPLVVRERELFVAVSAGIALYPDHGDCAQDLLKNAEVAMGRAKDEGRDDVKFFTPSMNVDTSERLALENALRKALDSGEFVLHYQPLVELATGQVTGFEALVRWSRPGYGLVLPSDFIPLAEATGLIVPMGRWVLEKACAQIKEWDELGYPGLIVAVNLSAREFERADLPAQVREALKASAISPSALELEITETVAMRNADASFEMLAELKGLGVGISLDDFGTGYSSLGYLRRFPIDTLKIDSSFVQGLDGGSDADAIVDAVTGLARTLGVAVVAEGVETERQLELLRAFPCQRIQGYLFSAPLAPHEALRLLVEGRTLSPEA